MTVGTGPAPATYAPAVLFGLGWVIWADLQGVWAACALTAAAAALSGGLGVTLYYGQREV